MTYVDIINLWGAAGLAEDLGLPTKNVRRWIDQDSIPAGWFSDIAKAAAKRGYHGVTVEALAEAAERRRMARSEPSPQPERPAQ